VARLADQAAAQTVEHVMALLREDLPADLRAQVQIGAHLPGLLAQLPFLSVAAEEVATRAVGLARTVSLQRVQVDGAPVDLGYRTGDASECRFTITLWAFTRPQLESLRAAVMALPFAQREHSWETAAVVSPDGESTPRLRHRTMFLRCRLVTASPGLASPLAPPPPLITITANLTTLRSGPGNAFSSLGQARRDDQFELLGRSADAAWVQGCCRNGQPVWIEVSAAELTLPLAMTPLASPTPTPLVAPGFAAEPPGEGSEAEGGEGPRSPGAVTASVDVGAAILATAAAPIVSVWRQDLTFIGYLEATQEPLEAAGAPISEVDIVRRIEGPAGGIDTERTRRFADREEIVETLPG